ncbi:MAG TPA: preprotein translocase subunit SecE [Tepidisphaeraceae bacterium]|jgi:preprotein translocase SecE subunit
MAVTKEKKMASTAITAPDDDDDRKPTRQSPPKSKDDAGEGFFTIRKRGQGYWTRMLTSLSAAVLVALTANFLYTDVLISVSSRARIIGVTVFVVVGSLFTWWLINRQQSVEFLIATDSEMKKVNWTTREELIGSTKVVILFMFFIAFFLFAADVIFGKLFQVLTILKFGPFG